MDCQANIDLRAERRVEQRSVHLHRTQVQVSKPEVEASHLPLTSACFRTTIPNQSAGQGGILAVAIQRDRAVDPVGPAEEATKATRLARQ